MTVDKVTVYRREHLAPSHKVTGENCEYIRRNAVPVGPGGRCAVSFYEIPPGKANYPFHYHETHEEIFYILSGRGILITEEGEREITPGDVIACPPAPGGAHRIENRGREPLIYLEFDTVSYPELCYYPLTGSVGILRGDRAANEFFDRATKLDYAKDLEDAAHGTGPLKKYSKSKK